MWGRVSLTVLRRGAAMGAAAGVAAAWGMPSECKPSKPIASFISQVLPEENASADVRSVTMTERPKDEWIEVEQRKRADSFIDWQGSIDTDYVEALLALRSAYKLPLEMMRSLAAHFRAEAVAGLAGQPSSVKMLPTFVNKRVTGAEQGDFFALDLGGTNFRVLRLTLEGGGRVGPVKSMKFEIPDAIKKGTGAELFGFLADSVARFIALECGAAAGSKAAPSAPQPQRRQLPGSRAPHAQRPRAPPNRAPVRPRPLRRAPARWLRRAEVCGGLQQPASHEAEATYPNPPPP
jgi:hypothetical protein